MFDKRRLRADFSTRQLKISLLHEHVSFKCINTMRRIKGKPFSMRKTCRVGLQSRFWSAQIIIVSLLIHLTWRNGVYSSVTFAVVALHCQPLLCGWSWDIMWEEEETTCETVGTVVFSFPLSSLMLLLMKGLTAAVALLKQQLVVSDKVWKKRQWRNRGSEGQPACLIFLFAEEDTLRGRPPLWGDAGIIKSILFSVNLLPCLWFYTQHQRDKTEVKKMFLWNIHGIFKKST